ncbi:3-deoxy-D-manno-octulosonate 8-phosphate phosphatase [Legionella quinlivanii]|uniref:3-deoxy-D-manno-octulosonate 8-phosphate phosphatase KdsC n=1 Tax=Legionella quinlivanii TaxID=45073 RepID=A0A364LMG1_9GAMM|nr:HAD hydrolase family protein [Legionella quinlivanii]RAP37836.1 3-deoxy-D-manno-octulosonate 8-phosphate phosphatase [Legionella quinlivanii]
MNQLNKGDLFERAKKVKCLICDIDGVMTDGKVYIGSSGEDTRAFNAHDGIGMQMLIAAGIHLAVITTSNSNVIYERMQKVGIMCFCGQVDKRKAYTQIKEELQLHDGDFAYIGDDLSDLMIIKQVGLGITVPNAVQQVKEWSHWITERSGGEGAVREICEIILMSQDKFEMALEGYLAGTACL